MTPESLKQMKKFLDARDLLLGAREQYEGTLGALKGALRWAEDAMGEYSDPEAVAQIASMKKLVESLPQATFDTLNAIAETMEALAHEVTVNEEHVPAGGLMTLRTARRALPS